jgi:hypothetical protein
MMTIASRIKKDIPKRISRFVKLISGKPYRFYKWKPDENRVECMYYRFKGSKGAIHTKRIPLKELVAAVRTFQKTGSFNNSDYTSRCPVTSSSGPCGFAVIGRYLEFRNKANYKGYGKGFQL